MNGLTCLLWGWYNTQTVGNALWLREVGGQTKTERLIKPYATFASMIILNNSLPCTLGWGFGVDGGHGTPQCDSNALIFSVWPIHMCSHHCFHILNRDCNVTQGNCKFGVYKSPINFCPHLRWGYPCRPVTSRACCLKSAGEHICIIFWL